LSTTGHAPEYDRWFHRIGRYDLGREENARWFEEVELVRNELSALGAVDSALELACGTGLWTQQLEPICSTITAVDASPEMLDLNRQRLGSHRVTYVEADVFDWEPDRAYDLVFFAFWLTHVPRELFGPFWEKVARALEPGGRVFLVDNVLVPNFRPLDHSDEDPTTGTMTRELEDGRSFRIVKIFYEPDALARMLELQGWSCAFASAGRYLLYGSATR
jgi:ubiquinone/menaquinone biosynthesis C-methylase UbiE